MTDDAHLPDWLTLACVAGVGPMRFRALIERFGSPARVLALDAQELEARGVPPKLARALAGADRDAAHRLLAWRQRDPRHHILTLDDPAYPEPLRQIADAPPLLFVRGDAAVLARPQLAVVGSRSATPAALRNARELARQAVEAGLVVTSGLAIGVDGAAHQGALEGGGPTVAVLGSGLERIYPRRNRPLAGEVVEAGGCLVSELPPDAEARARHFPRRNRIISGLSRGVLVVEAGLRSGSLITARLAAEQGREVFALPGSIHNPAARGCHALIRQGAVLTESITDILDELGLAATIPVPGPAPAPGVHQGLDPNALKILEYMADDPVAPELLCGALELTPDTLSSILLMLELRGLVTSLPGGLYAKTP